MEYKKPQATIIQGNVGIYPLTTADQVILADGTRLEKDGKINVDVANSADSAKLGGKAPEYYLQPRNLLDNSDFRNPVNQRGQTSYSVSEYTIDRWILYSSASETITLTDEGITFTTGNNSFYQRVLKKSIKPGATYTLAYCTDGVVRITTLVFTDSSAGTTEAFDVAISVEAGKTLSWAALYEGSYTADTLPPYVPKGYTAELLECLRYYVDMKKLNGAGMTGWNLYTPTYMFPIPMRAKPTITLSNPVTGTQNVIGKYNNQTGLYDDMSNVRISGASNQSFSVVSDNGFIVNESYMFNAVASADM